MKPETDASPPLAIPLSRAPALCGISRSTLYRLAAAGRIRLIKCGRTTLIDGQSLRDYLGDLPMPKLIRRDFELKTWQRKPSDGQ